MDGFMGKHEDCGTHSYVNSNKANNMGLIVQN